MEYKKCESELFKHKYLVNKTFISKNKSHYIKIDSIVCSKIESTVNDFEVLINYKNSKTGFFGIISISDFKDLYYIEEVEI